MLFRNLTPCPSLLLGLRRLRRPARTAASTSSEAATEGSLRLKSIKKTGYTDNPPSTSQEIYLMKNIGETGAPRKSVRRRRERTTGLRSGRGRGRRRGGGRGQSHLPPPPPHPQRKTIRTREQGRGADGHLCQKWVKSFKKNYVMQYSEVAKSVFRYRRESATGECRRC